MKNNLEIELDKSTGLVLSGGGTKGLAHAGVLKFLTEHHISIDMIAGTSAGALVGALYAFGTSPKDILSFFQSVHFFNWKHFTFNKPGIVSSEVFQEYLKPILKDHKIKESTIPLLLTATDLYSGKLHVFDEDTKVIDAVISSAAIPGVTSPYEVNSSLFCDGGVVNNFPADLLRDYVDHIIGVYLSPLNEMDQGGMKSWWSVTERAFDILTYHSEKSKFELCDWLISLNELSNYGRFETSKKRTKEIFDIGYEKARATFEKSGFRTKLKKDINGKIAL